MALEIERKFLVTSDAWRACSVGTTIKQGYLSREPDRTVRIRLAGGEAFITIKGRSHGISRSEFEFPIPIADADSLLNMCIPPLVEKTRYMVHFGGQLWSVDEFHGDNAGLLLAEIELLTDQTAFETPQWIGDEVSYLPRYFNANLSEHPYREWSDSERSSQTV